MILVGKLSRTGLVHVRFPVPSSRGPSVVWVCLTRDEAKARGVRVFSRVTCWR